MYKTKQRIHEKPFHVSAKFRDNLFYITSNFLDDITQLCVP